mmetsp:Transcript_18629/g.26962  ORF Transcript_18629/g.26962 Transcript_18629/m.26962 type:complete len:498 (+) Transcript_18629:136-1629(+)
MSERTNTSRDGHSKGMKSRKQHSGSTLQSTRSYQTALSGQTSYKRSAFARRGIKKNRSTLRVVLDTHNTRHSPRTSLISAASSISNHSKDTRRMKLIPKRPLPYELLRHIAFKNFIATVIVVDLAFFIASTHKKLRHRQQMFYAIEVISSSIFLVEYIARLAMCTQSRTHRDNGPFLGRMCYMVSINALIDAFATFPIFIELLTGIKLPTMTFLRVFRLMRLTKTLGFSRSLRSVQRVVYYNREILWVALLLCTFLVLFTSFLLYFFRPPDSTRLPHDSEFGSIPATMYLSALMLSGQGGPTGDLPWYTKSIVLMTSFFSVAMFAIPASMFTWGFEAEAERLAAKSYRLRHKQDGDSSSSSDDSYGWCDDSFSDSSDEEYERIIAGEDEMTEDIEDDMKILVRGLSTRISQVESSFVQRNGVSNGMSKLSSGLYSIQSMSDRRSSSESQTTLCPDVKLSLEQSIKRLEEKVNATTSKLDRLLEIIEKKGVVLDEKQS